MGVRLLAYSQTFAAQIRNAASLLQARLDGLLLQTEGVPQEQPRGGLPTWAIVLIVVGGVLVILCLLPVCVISILTLLGPSIGNVFSNIIMDL